jgi:hypothetical protein
MLLFVFAGCSSPCTSPATLHTCRDPGQTWEPWVPSFEGEMTLDQAFDLLELTPPVEVDFFSSLTREDVLSSAGDDIRGLLHDSEGRYVGFRRTIAYTNETFICRDGTEDSSEQSYPKFFLLNYNGFGLDELLLRGFEHETINVPQVDPRLKAFSLVALDWVYKTYKTPDQWSVISENAVPAEESYAGNILYAFGDDMEKEEPTAIQKPLDTDGSVVQGVALIVPNPKPSWKGGMTPAEAAQMLGLTLPISVGFMSFSDRGAVRGSIIDTTGKGIVFSHWALGGPIEFHLSFWDKNEMLSGLPNEIKMKDDDPRLKAFAVLALDWVEKRFTKTQINRIREETPPLKQSTARNILNLFKKEQ